MTSPQHSRSAELAANLDAVEDRLAAAAHAADRTRDEITLIAVSKTWPIEDVAMLTALGVQDFGENRDREAASKALLLPEVRWHFVGAVQSSKARNVAAYADVVHSVDRYALLAGLAKAAERAERTLKVLLQVSIDGDGDRSGIRPADLPRLADAAATLPGVTLAGVMAVAPREADPATAFAVLREVSAQLVRDHPEATWVSAGMSGDLEQAIAAGSTHVRVGSALFGHRSAVLR